MARFDSITVGLEFDLLSWAVWVHRISEIQHALDGIERVRWEREWSMLTGEYWPYP